MEVLIVTDIKKINSKKVLVFVNYEEGFELYVSEIRKYNITLDCELDEKTYLDIMDMLKKRCFERAGYLLSKSDKSVYDFKDRLRQNHYPEEIVNDIANKYIDYNYLNDERFAANYVRYYISSKSISRIKNELYNKHIDKNLIDNAFINYYQSEDKDSESIQINLIKKELLKKKTKLLSGDRNSINKVISSLIRKGFNYDDIMMVYKEEFSEIE